MTAISVIAGFLLLVFIASKTKSAGSESTYSSDPPQEKPSVQIWEPNPTQ